VILAELEVFHSRAFSPTRRLALGRRLVPVDPPPGFGPLLLGGIIAVGAEELDDDDHDGLMLLMAELQQGQRIVQPRLRNRFQSDHQGLGRTTAVLRGGGEELEYDFDGNGSPLQMALAAVYAAGQLPIGVRPRVFDVVRKGLRWRGEIGPSLVAHLSGRGGVPSWTNQGVDPVAWAIDLLGLTNGHMPSKREVQKRYRELLRAAHPDHGGADEAAAERIADLGEARRILLG